jgi:hypothetical protein
MSLLRSISACSARRRLKGLFFANTHKTAMGSRGIGHHGSQGNRRRSRMNASCRHGYRGRMPCSVDSRHKDRLYEARSLISELLECRNTPFGSDNSRLSLDVTNCPILRFCLRDRCQLVADAHPLESSCSAAKSRATARP